MPAPGFLFLSDHDSCPITTTAHNNGDVFMDEIAGNEIARREFLGRCSSVLQALLVAGVAGPFIQACEMTHVIASVDVEDEKGLKVNVTALDADGKFLITDEEGPDRKSILVVRKNATTYIAMSMECTHRQCEVDAPSNNTITCPCHSSQYDMEGAVIAGPAPSPLKRYAAVYDAASAILTIEI